MDEKYSCIPKLPSDPATRLLSERLRSFLLKAKEENIGVLFAYGVGNNEHEQVRWSGVARAAAGAAASEAASFELLKRLFYMVGGSSPKG